MFWGFFFVVTARGSWQQCLGGTRLCSVMNIVRILALGSFIPNEKVEGEESLLWKTTLLT